MRLLIAFAALTLQACGGVKAPCELPYSCPSPQTLNCMPIVPAERAPLCSGECAAWIKANCPSVEFSY